MPPSAKCTFECSAVRNYETDDASEDYQYFDGDTTIAFFYAIYYDDTEISKGYSVYTNFGMPLSAVTNLAQSSAFALLAVLGYAL